MDRLVELIEQRDEQVGFTVNRKKIDAIDERVKYTISCLKEIADGEIRKGGFSQAKYDADDQIYAYNHLDILNTKLSGKRKDSNEEIADFVRNCFNRISYILNPKLSENLMSDNRSLRHTGMGRLIGLAQKGYKEALTAIPILSNIANKGDRRLGKNRISSNLCYDGGDKARAYDSLFKIIEDEQLDKRTVKLVTDRLEEGIDYLDNDLNKGLFERLKSSTQRDRYIGMGELVELADKEGKEAQKAIFALKYIAHGKTRPSDWLAPKYDYGDQTYAFDSLLRIAENNPKFSEEIAGFIKGCFEEKGSYLSSAKKDKGKVPVWTINEIEYEQLGGEFAKRLYTKGGAKFDSLKAFKEIVGENPSTVYFRNQPKDKPPAQAAYNEMVKIKGRASALK